MTQPHRGGCRPGTFPPERCEQMKKKRLRALAAMLCLAVFGCTLSGCAADAASRQLDFDEWTTWDISTPLSLSADYFLTEYTDADKIWRYDSAGDCLMSMRYGY